MICNLFNFTIEKKNQIKNNKPITENQISRAGNTSRFIIITKSKSIKLKKITPLRIEACENTPITFVFASIVTCGFIIPNTIIFEI